MAYFTGLYNDRRPPQPASANRHTAETEGAGPWPKQVVTGCMLPLAGLWTLLLFGCAGYDAQPMNDSAVSIADIRRDHLPYVNRLTARNPADITLVVIHCTELPDLATAREYGERIHYPDTQTGNAGHYYIDRDGSVFEYVPPERVAHHVSGHNANSIGIELVNSGRYPNWYQADQQEMSEAYPDPQIEALNDLLTHLQEQLPGLNRIAGHEALDTRMVPASDNPQAMVRRKLDPGPLFPWRQVLDRHPQLRQE